VRLLLTGIVFLASLVAAVFVHAARADASWERPQQLDSGSKPTVRLLEDGRPYLAYAKGDSFDPSHLLVSRGNEPTQRLKVPRAGRVVAFDVDRGGKLVALREAKRRIVALEGSKWRPISRGVDAKLSVADSGAAVAAWLQAEQSRVVVHAAVRPRGAIRFGPAQRLSGPTQRHGQTLAVAVDDQGAAVVAFAERRDLWIWRPGAPAHRIHDANDVTAGAFTAATAVRGRTAVVAFTRLEDREPPEYRLEVATQVGDAAPVVETVARNVSAIDVAAAVDADGSPVALSAPIGPPYSLRLHRRTAAWAEAAAIPATGAPSTVAYADGAVTWTEGTKGFARFAGQTLSLGRAGSPAAAVSDGRAMVVWDRGPGRSMRLATFTP
jgi:hypothetical protein